MFRHPNAPFEMPDVDDDYVPITEDGSEMDVDVAYVDEEEEMLDSSDESSDSSSPRHDAVLDTDQPISPDEALNACRQIRASESTVFSQNFFSRAGFPPLPSIPPPPVHSQPAAGSTNRYRFSRDPSSALQVRRDASDQVRDLLREGRNLYFDQDHDRAVEKLNEAIRLDPRNPEGYNLLALVYEHLQEINKAVDARLISSLITNDMDSFILCYELASKHGFLQEALFCAKRLLRRSNTRGGQGQDESTRPRWIAALARLYEELGELGEAARWVKEMALLRPMEPEWAVKYGRMLLQRRGVSKAEKVVEMMTTTLRKIKERVEEGENRQLEEEGGSRSILEMNRNILVESSNRSTIGTAGSAPSSQPASAHATPGASRNYTAFDVLELLLDAYLVQDEFASGIEAVTDFSQWLRRDIRTFPIPVLQNYATCLILAGRPEANLVIRDLIPTQTVDSENEMILLAELGRVYIEYGEPSEAVRLFQRLFQSIQEHESQAIPPFAPPVNAAILASLIADCYKQTTDYESALKFYTFALRRLRSDKMQTTSQGYEFQGDQNILDIRQKTSELLRENLERPSDAREVMQGRYDVLNDGSGQHDADDDDEMSMGSDDEDEDHGFEITDDLRTQITHAKESAYNQQFDSQSFLEASAPFIRLLETLRPKRRGRGPNTDWSWRDCCSALGEVRWLEFVLKIIETLLSLDAAHARNLLQTIRLSKCIPRRRHHDVLSQMGTLEVSALCRMGQYQEAIRFIQLLFRNDPELRESVILWNTFARILSLRGKYSRFDRFFAQMAEQDEHRAAKIAGEMLLGARYLENGSGVLSCKHYLQALKLVPEDPLVLLCVAVSHLNISLARTVVDREKQILRCLGFMQLYFDVSTDPQERNFNMARMYHHYGITAPAIEHYEMVLAGEDRRNVLRGGETIRTDLKREAAYNLAQIYKQAGKLNLARKVLFENVLV